MEESYNQSFFEKATRIVLDNLTNEQFGVTDLADQLNFSRSQLHRKIKVKTGKSASQFIRDIRLEEAMNMLVADTGTASEIAYRVGFSSPAYFNRCFQKVFGISPGEVKKRPGAVIATKPPANTTQKTDRLFRKRTIIVIGLISLISVSIIYLLSGKKEIREPSIAVLPLHNLTGDPDQEYFVKGFHDALIGALGQISALRVTSRTSTLRYTDEENLPPIQQIAQELGVQTLIEGSVMGTGDNIRIQLQLIEAFPDEKHIWAKEYVRDIRNILILQHDVVRNIADEIHVKLTDSEQDVLNREQQVDPEAYKAYLKGRFHWDKLTEKDLDLAMQYFERSKEIDPDYPLAYAGIAMTWVGRLQQGLTSFSESKTKMQLATLKSKVLQLENIPAEVHFLFAGKNTWVDWDFDAAVVEFEKCLKVNPNYSAARAYYCHLLNIIGQPEKASEQIEMALELDPFNPLYQALYGMHLIYQREYDQAISLLLETLKQSPSDPVALSTLRTAYHLKGKYQEALEIWRLSYYAKGDQGAMEALQKGAEQGGYPGALIGLAEFLIERSKTTYVTPWQIATLYTRAGERDLAVTWLKKAYDANDNNMPYIGIDPIFDVLRQHAGFIELLEKMGLSKT